MVKFTKRQQEILEIVKENEPISGKEIADKLSLTRATLRPDLAILTMTGTLEAKTGVGYFYKGYDMKWRQEDRRLVKEYKALPIVVKDSSSVYDAIVQIFIKDVGTIYVVDEEGFLSGVLSRKDLLRAALGRHNLNELPVSVIMTRMPNIVMIHPEDTLVQAAKKMFEYKIDSLPVVEEVNGEKQQYKVIGRVTKTTILRVFVEMFDP